MSFHKKECSSDRISDDTYVDVVDVVQRLLSMNINLNFLNLKSDFTEALELIKQFVQAARPSASLPVLTHSGSVIMMKMLGKTSNVAQNIMCFKVLARIILLMTRDE